MAEAQDDSGNAPAPGGGDDFGMTVNEMREWLRNWIGNATGQSPDSINESTPMVELGLSSRDAVVLGAQTARMHKPKVMCYLYGKFRLRRLISRMTFCWC